MLLAMAVDKRVHVRELAIRRLLKARLRKSNGKSMRNVLLPEVNFEASSYTDFTNWTNSELSSPPMMVTFSTECHG